MTFEELQDLLAEQFSCDTGDLTRSTALEDLDADHEDMIELAWALGEAIGVEIDESELRISPSVSCGALCAIRKKTPRSNNKRKACPLRQAFLVSERPSRPGRRRMRKRES